MNRQEKTARWIGILFLLIGIFSYYIVCGISLTDEVGARATALIGNDFANKYVLKHNMNQGRITDAIGWIFFANPFLRENVVIYRSVSAIMIIANFILISFFEEKVLKLNNFRFLNFLLMAIFIPFSFEHTMPNGFVGPFIMAGNILLLSFLSFIKYLEKNNKRYLIISCILLLLTLCCYEMFIMFTPMYLILILRFCEKK